MAFKKQAPMFVAISKYIVLLYFCFKYSLLNQSIASAGDCTQDITLSTCSFNKTTCDLSATNRPLSSCGGKPANYLRLEYYCVPCK